VEEARNTVSVVLSRVRVRVREEEIITQGGR